MAVYSTLSAYDISFNCEGLQNFSTRKIPAVSAGIVYTDAGIYIGYKNAAFSANKCGWYTKGWLNYILSCH